MQNYIHEVGELTRTVYVSGRATGRQIAGFVSGTDKGQLSLLLHPFLDGGISNYNVHSGSVSCMAVTPDFRYLFSASEDGSLFIFRITEERINLDVELLTPDE